MGNLAKENGGISKWEDPIVKRTRALRQKYAEEFGHDIDKIFQDIFKRQSKPKRKCVSLKPRKPKLKSNIA